MTKVYVQYNEQCLASHHESEEYGRWFEEMDFTVLSATLTREGWGSYDEYDLPNVELGSEVYVVVVIYRHGNSFGSSDGNGEIIWTFSSRQKAEELVSLIRENEEKYNFQFVDDHGELITMTNPAFDYFSSIQSIWIKPLTLTQMCSDSE